MNYSVFILPRAKRELAGANKQDYEKIITAIRNLSNNPRPPNSSKLVGRQGWRIRIGNFRVIYGIDDAAKTVTILQVGHRREVYR